MRDGALKWGLRLLGLFLVIAPILIAFSINDWDFRKTVLPSNEEMVQIQDRISGIFGEGFSQNTLTFGDPFFSDGNVRVSATFTSPLNEPIRIIDINIGISDQGRKIMDLRLDEDTVEVPARGTVNLTLVGPYSGDPPANPQFESMNVIFEIYGVSIDIHTGVMGGIL